VIVNNVKKILKQNGTFIIEVQYLINTLLDCTFDNIYHEHVNYWCLHSLKKYFENFNFVIVEVEKIKTHGGSLRVFIKKNKKKIKVNKKVKEILLEEKNIGIFNFNIFEKFKNQIENIKNNTIKNMKNLKKKYNKIYGFGAPAKATIALNYFNIANYFNGIIEDNNLKHNKYIPGTNLKIYSLKKIKKVDCLIILAWNFFNEIKNANNKLTKKIISIKHLEN